MPDLPSSRPFAARPPLGAIKRLEHVLKKVAALLLAVLLWRPGRRRKAEERLRTAGRLLLVRADNRVGEALLTTPLVEALRQAPRPFEVDVLVHARCARVLEDLPGLRRIHTLQAQKLALLHRLRRERYDVVVDCGNWEEPSVGSALLSRLCAPHAAVLGPAVWPLRPLRTHPVPPMSETRSERRQRLHLLSPLGVLTDAPMRFRHTRSTKTLEQFERSLGPGLRVLINPGGRLGWRRVPADVFSAAARAVLQEGCIPIVTWGPGEESLADHICRQASGAVPAPPTTLDELAQLMRSAALTVCNNTGPMHLSVAVGTPTLALFLHMDVERWGHPWPPHVMLDLTAHVPHPEQMAARTVEELGRLLQGLKAHAS